MARAALALGAMLAGASAKLNDRELATAVLGITMTVPPSGQATAITGKVTSATPNTVFSNYKVSILTSGDNGATWWDKSHGPYRNHQLANPGYDAGDAQNAGVVLQADGTYSLNNYQASPNDATSDLWIAFVVPQSYDMRYPQYQIEGTAIRGDLLAAELAWTVVSKTRGTISIGSGPFPGVAAAIGGGGGGNTPAAPPAASPAASPAAAAASPAAAADPSPAAAAPSTAALPEASSAPAATAAGTTSSGATSVTAALGAAAAAVAAVAMLVQ